MTSKTLAKAAGTVCAIAILVGSLSGCGTAETQNQSTTPSQQTVSTPSQQTTTQTNSQSGDQSSQQSAEGRQPPSGGQDMTAILTRAADILGISSDKFITAFNNARPQAPSGDGQHGQPPSGQDGEPPAAPTGQQGEKPSESPSGQQQGKDGTGFMTEIYTKMADELGISADKIEAAMSQAMQELSNQ
ncbi:MAG: hypothetical protein WC566_12145 [Dehalococcoidia bacterium]